MFENSTVSEKDSIPSDEYLLEEISKIKEELNRLKDLKEKTVQSSKPKRKPVKRRAATKRKPVKRRAATKRKPVKRRAATKRKPVKRRINSRK